MGRGGRVHLKGSAPHLPHSPWPSDLWALGHASKRSMMLLPPFPSLEAMGHEPPHQLLGAPHHHTLLADELHWPPGFLKSTTPGFLRQRPACELTCHKALRICSREPPRVTSQLHQPAKSCPQGACRCLSQRSVTWES